MRVLRRGGGTTTSGSKAGSEDGTVAGRLSCPGVHGTTSVSSPSSSESEIDTVSTRRGGGWISLQASSSSVEEGLLSGAPVGEYEGDVGVYEGVVGVCDGLGGGFRGAGGGVAGGGLAGGGLAGGGLTGGGLGGEGWGRGNRDNAARRSE